MILTDISLLAHTQRTFSAIMAGAGSGWVLNSVCSAYRHVTRYNLYPGMFIPARDYAARKGTREKHKKKKVKVVVEKVGFIPHKMRKSYLEAKKNLYVKVNTDDSHKPVSDDNVWLGQFYRKKIYSFEEAVQCHRETHHPTIYNLPNSAISAFVELNMQGEKKTKFLSEFTNVAGVPHKFDLLEDRKVLAFCNIPEVQKAAKDLADLAGGRELIKQIQTGEIVLSDFDYLVATPDVMPDLLLIKGLLKNKFPKPSLGTLGVDIRELIRTFKNGIRYTATSNEFQKDYGKLEVTFGTLNMDTKQLEENFAALITHLESRRPKRSGPFILRTQLKSAPSTESLKVDFEKYLAAKEEPKQPVEEDDTIGIIATQ